MVYCLIFSLLTCSFVNRFDSSYDRGTPLASKIGVGRLIKGALVLLYRTIPYSIIKKIRNDFNFLLPEVDCC